MSEDLQQQYGNAVCLHLWYRGSRFSFHQGKESKELADRYRNLAHQLREEYVKLQQGELRRLQQARGG